MSRWPRRAKVNRQRRTVERIFQQSLVSRTSDNLMLREALEQLHKSELTVNDIKEKLLRRTKLNCRCFASKNYEAEKAKTWLLQTLWRVGAKGDKHAIFHLVFDA